MTVKKNKTIPSPPPPPPLLPTIFNVATPQTNNLPKHKRFHWKLSPITSLSNFNNHIVIKPIPQISENLQTSLSLFFSAQTLHRSVTSIDLQKKKNENKKMSVTMTNNLRLIQIQCLTSWKGLTLKEILLDLFECGKYWEAQIDVFFGLKFDCDSDEYDENEKNQDIDCITFLKILSRIKQYWHSRCSATISLKETKEMLISFKVLLNNLKYMNGLIFDNSTALETLLGTVLKSALYLNGVDQLPPQKLFCLSNLSKLSSFKNSNQQQQKNMTDEGDDTKKTEYKLKIISETNLLDLIEKEVSDNLLINDFIIKFSKLEYQNVNDIVVLYKNLTQNIILLKKVLEDCKSWKYVPNDSFKNYFISKFDVILKEFEILEKMYKKEMKNYCDFVATFETGTYVNLNFYLFDPSKSSTNFGTENFELFEILYKFLNQFIKLQRKNRKARELIKNYNNIVIRRRDEYEDMLSDMLIKDNYSSNNEYIKKLKEISIHKKNNRKVIKDSEYGIDKSVLKLLAKTRAM